MPCPKTGYLEIWRTGDVPGMVHCRCGCPRTGKEIKVGLAKGWVFIGSLEHEQWKSTARLETLLGYLCIITGVSKSHRLGQVWGKMSLFWPFDPTVTGFQSVRVMHYFS